MEKQKNQSIFICFILILMLALRHPSMGSDLWYGQSYGYLGQYTYISELSWRDAFFHRISSYERGYILLCKLLSSISPNQQFLLVGCAAVSLIPIFYVVYRRSEYPSLSAFVFMGLSTFLLLFSGLRQSIALGICFLSLLYIEERKPIKFMLTVFLARTFHTSAWLFLAAYPIYHFPMKRSWRPVTYLIPIVCYLMRYPLFRIFSKLLREDAVIDDNNAITLFVVFFLIYIFCCLFSGEKKDIAGLKNLFFVACCIQALAGVNMIVSRAGYYFMNSLIILLPMVIGRMRNRKNAWIFKYMIAVCFILFGLYAIYGNTWAQAYPYKWFWEITF